MDKFTSDNIRLHAKTMVQGVFGSGSQGAPLGTLYTRVWEMLDPNAWVTAFVGNPVIREWMERVIAAVEKR